MNCIHFSLVCFGWSITKQEIELKLLISTLQGLVNYQAGPKKRWICQAHRKYYSISKGNLQSTWLFTREKNTGFLPHVGFFCQFRFLNQKPFTKKKDAKHRLGTNYFIPFLGMNTDKAGESTNICLNPENYSFHTYIHLLTKGIS